MPCKNRNALGISNSDILKKSRQLDIFKSLPLPFGCMYFSETLFSCPFLLLGINPERFNCMFLEIV